MVDAYEDNEEVLESVEEEYLPEPMQEMDADERKAYVKKVTNERESIKKEIQKLSAKRKQFIADNKPVAASENTLDHAMVNAVKDLGKSKQLIFE